ncbi:hypothetical protein EK21DRAFT_75362 [Setomelanomma holmii]|uniref:N-acetyltransferase domain-containing protein n=1 Tax=Setomelanomma holmii TaxID=210430 RepID=A0A9P4H2G8_9PLEO|nr:hypothetical protein EK21DRAFT_75362 [Setomelanomma holmii]
MSSETAPFTVRRAAHVQEVKALWWSLMKELGWNRAEEDADTHFEVADNGKHWLLLIPKGSESPQGMVIPFVYPNSTAWVGFFIMNAAFRGQGLGRELWKEMELVFKTEGTTMIGLDGVEEQVETYKRRGFEDCARIPLMTREGLGTKPLAKLDLQHTGLDRSAYWASSALLSRDDARGYVVVADGVSGFIFARKCQHGIRIGPLYANSYSHARSLLHRLMVDFADMKGTFIAEIFGTNSSGRRVFEELGWQYAGLSYHRMWLQGRVPIEQQEGGVGAKGMYAIFDACAG